MAKPSDKTLYHLRYKISERGGGILILHAFSFVNFAEYSSAKRGLRIFSFWFGNKKILEPKRIFFRACFQDFRNHFLLICGSSFPDRLHSLRMPRSLFGLYLVWSSWRRQWKMKRQKHRNLRGAEAKSFGNFRFNTTFANAKRIFVFC